MVSQKNLPLRDSCSERLATHQLTSCSPALTSFQQDGAGGTHLTACDFIQQRSAAYGFSLAPCISVNGCTWVRQWKFTGVEGFVPLPRFSFSTAPGLQSESLPKAEAFSLSCLFFWMNRLLACWTFVVINHCWAPQVLSGAGSVPRLLQPSCPQQEQPRGCERPASPPPRAGQPGSLLLLAACKPTSTGMPKAEHPWEEGSRLCLQSLRAPGRGTKPWWGVWGWKPNGVFQQTLRGVTNTEAQDEWQGCWNCYLCKYWNLGSKKSRFMSQ